ncbi:hypothetical protein PV10_06064 [Exophiala mesophila]|uniref:Uncharacterized protein n=1 Tax=Exophiala mesophila TaxID=212818 RepID=A0A0D1WR19_EXOME|nr:uncharacterized protein PV10_06064 [Exophiala mesophila]KIV91535.1 hypothetical protein PV10_06064 [Exophiala mesophila]
MQVCDRVLGSWSNVVQGHIRLFRRGMSVMVYQVFPSARIMLALRLAFDMLKAADFPPAVRGLSTLLSRRTAISIAKELPHSNPFVGSLTALASWWSGSALRIFAILTPDTLQVEACSMTAGLAPWGIVEALQILPRTQASPRYESNIHLNVILK